MLCHRRTPWDWPLSLPLSDSLPPAAPPRRAYSAKTPPPLPPKTYKSCRVLLPPRAASCPLHRQHLSLESEVLSASPKHSVTPLFVPVQCISSDVTCETRRRRHKSNSLRSHSPGSVCPGASSCTTCAAASSSTSTDHFLHSRLSPKSVSALCNAALSAASRRRRSKTNCSWSASETIMVNNNNTSLMTVAPVETDRNQEVRLRRVKEPTSTITTSASVKCTSRRGVSRVPPLPNLPPRGAFSTFVGNAEDRATSECIGENNAAAAGLQVDISNANSMTTTTSPLRSFSSLSCCPTCALQQTFVPSASTAISGSNSSDNLPPHQHHRKSQQHRRSKTPPATLQNTVSSIASTISESLCCTCLSQCTCATTTATTKVNLLQSCTCTPTMTRAHVPLSKSLKTKLSKWFARGSHVSASSSKVCTNGSSELNVEAVLSKAHGKSSRRERSVECIGRLSRNKDMHLHCEECGGGVSNSSNNMSISVDMVVRQDDTSSSSIPCAASFNALPGNMTESTKASATRRSAPRGANAHGVSGAVNSSNNATQLASFTANMKMLKKMGWYWGPLSFEEAEQLLANRRDGAFLVRDSAHESYILSLSFRARAVTFHTRIEHVGGKFSFWSQPESHSATTVVEFVEKAMDSSQRGLFHYFLQSSALGQPPVQVSLLHPVSRFSAPLVPSLRHLCRFEVLHHVRRDHINELPLPKLLKDYLREKQYYAEYIHQYNEATREEQLQSVTSQPSRAQIETRPLEVAATPAELSSRPLPLQNSHWV